MPDNQITSALGGQKTRICPYTGLRAFSAEEVLYFKGREVHIEKAIGLLEEKKFLMLTGASGDGKSSLIYAGIIPNAQAGFIRAKFTNWVIADFRPERKPLDNMVSALASKLQYPGNEMVKNSLCLGYSALVSLYKNSAIYLDTDTEEWKNADAQTRKKLMGSTPNLLILVDQFEEFFTNPENFYKGKSSPDSRTVVNLLLETNKIALKKGLPIYIICTMRSDYIGNCAAFPGLPELIGQAHYFVPRLKRNEIFQIIDEPALLSGNAIAPRLVARLLKDIREGGDILPILQHALYQIWKTAAQDDAGTMDLIHYAKIGGMPKEELHRIDKETFEKWYEKQPDYKCGLLKNPSLDNVLNFHADELYETAHEYYNEHQDADSAITKELSQKIIKTAFTCLTKIHENKAVRNRMSVKEITGMIDDERVDTEMVKGLLNIFREPGNTLIRPYIPEPTKSVIKEWYDMELRDESVLDITHESLIRNWKRLAGWAKKENEAVTVFDELRQQLNRWSDKKRSKKYLLSQGQLNYFSNWYDRQQPTYAWMQRYMQDGESTLAALMTEDTSNVSLLTYGEDGNGVLLQQKAKELQSDVRYYLKKSHSHIARKKRLTTASLVVISALLAISVFLFFNVRQQKNIAVLAQNIAKSNEIAVKASMLLPDDPTIAFRLGEAAYEIHKTSLARQVLMNAYNYSPYYNLLSGHTDIVNAVSFSPNGMTIISASRDNTARLWDNEGKLLKILKGHDASIFSAAFSHDLPAEDLSQAGGSYALTASLDLTARIWDMQGNTMAVLSGHHSRLTSAIFSHDSRFVVTGSSDRTARIWGVDGKEISILKHDDAVLTVALSPDNKTILTSCKDNTVRLWNLKGELLRTIRDIDIKNLRFAGFSPEGRRILTNGGDNKIILWDLEGRKIALFTAEAKKLHSIEFSPDGKHIAAGSDDRVAYLWNVETPNLGVSEKKSVLLKEHISPVKFVKFSPEGDMLLTITEGFAMYLWNTNGELLQILRSNDLVENACFSPDGKMIASAHNKSTVRLWNISNPENSVLSGHTGYVWDANFSPDGEYIVTGSWDKTARLWDKDGKLLHLLSGHDDKVYFAGFSNYGQYIFTTSEDNTVRIWNIYGHLVTILKGHTERIYNPGFYPDGSYIITPSADGTARVWDMRGNQLLVLSGHQSAVRHAEFSPNGKYILTASADRTARIWNIDGKELYTLRGHDAAIYCAAISRNSKYIVTCSDDGIAKIWNIKGKCLATCTGHTDKIQRVSFSHNGKYIATASLDKTARLWDLQGRQLQVLRGHTDMVNTVRFSHDNKYILTSSDDGTARLWECPAEVDYENLKALNGKEINVYKGHDAAVQNAVFSPDGKTILTCSADGTARLWPLLVEDVLNEINKKNQRGKVWEMTDEDKRTYGIID